MRKVLENFVEICNCLKSRQLLGKEVLNAQHFLWITSKDKLKIVEWLKCPHLGSNRVKPLPVYSDEQNDKISCGAAGSCLISFSYHAAAVTTADLHMQALIVQLRSSSCWFAVYFKQQLLYNLIILINWAVKWTWRTQLQLCRSADHTRQLLLRNWILSRSCF
jgi:hypothetical protein